MRIFPSIYEEKKKFLYIFCFVSYLLMILNYCCTQSKNTNIVLENRWHKYVINPYHWKKANGESPFTKGSHLLNLFYVYRK